LVVAAVEAVIVAVAVPLEVCLKTVALPPLKAKKLPSKLCLAFFLSPLSVIFTASSRLVMLHHVLISTGAPFI